MAVTIVDVTPQVRGFIGMLAGTKSYKQTPFWDIFKTAQVLPMLKTGNIEFDFMIDSVVTAELDERGKNKDTKKVPDRNFRRISLVPGELFDSQSLTAEEMIQLQAGQALQITIGGQPVSSADQVVQRKIQRIREGINNKKNIMCTQALYDGKIKGKDDDVIWDFKIPTAKTIEYSTTNGFLQLVKRLKNEYTKINGGMASDKFLIGEDIATKILQDEQVQKTMEKLNYSNVAQELTADEKGRVMGVFMNQKLEEMGYSFDEKGVNIMPGNQIKLLSTSQLAQGYAAIEVKRADGTPDYYMGDEYIAVQPGTEVNPTALLFGKSGFMPVIIDPVSVQTWNVTIK